MRTCWTDWVHVVWSTKGVWLPGDPRGFRSRDHRIHSSGDHRDPPPPGEHEGLHRFARRISAGSVRLTPDVLETIGRAVLEKSGQINLAARALAVLATHCHIVLRVGDLDAKPLIGRLKQAASHCVRDRLPGSIWAEGCHVDRVHDENHYRQVVNYVLAHRIEGGWIWDQKAQPDLRQASGPASASAFTPPDRSRAP